jgi:hypothetical protein
MDDGTVLAIADSPTPCATAVAMYAKYGMTQVVTATGTTGQVDNQPVLFVTKLDWATAAEQEGPATALIAEMIAGTAAAAPAKKAAPTSTRGRKKK